MNNTITKTAIIAVIALSSLAITIPLVSAQVLPGDWLEFRHDGERTGFNPENADIVNAVEAGLHWWAHVPDDYDIWGDAFIPEGETAEEWWNRVPQVIFSSPVIGKNTRSPSLEAVYFGTEETFLFDPSDAWDYDPNVEDAYVYEYVNIGKVYAYDASPYSSLDIDVPLWEFQVGSDIAEFDPQNPFASRVYSTPVAAHVDVTDDQVDNPQDCLFVTCGFETDPIPPGGDDDIDERIFTGAVYCIDPAQTEDDPHFPGKRRPLVIWRFEDIQTNSAGIEVPHFTGTNFSSPVIWETTPYGYPILYTATADGRIFAVNCHTGERAAGWDRDKWKPDETGLETFTFPSGIWGSLTLVAKTSSDGDPYASLYIGTIGGKFYKINADDPSQPEDTDEWDAIQWPESTHDPAVVGPIYSTAAYYQSATGEKLVFTCWDGNVYCLDEDLRWQWTFYGTYKWPPDIPPDEQLDIIPRFDSSPAILPGVTLQQDTMNPDKPAGVYDVVYVVSEEGYIYGLDLDERGDIYADHDTYPGDTHELLYKAWIGGGAWSSPAVGFFGVAPTTPIPYVWVGTRSGQVRAYRGDTFGRTDDPDDASVATFIYEGGGGQFNSSPALTNEECYIGNQDGILYVFGLGGLLYGLDEPYEDSGEVTPSPFAVKPNVWIVTQSDYNSWNLVDDNTGPSTYAWGDTVYVIATGLDGNKIEGWNNGSPYRVTFKFTGEGVRSRTIRATVHKTSEGVLARAYWTLDPWQQRRRPTLVPGARFYVSCTQQSLLETAWSYFGEGYDPDDPDDRDYVLGEFAKFDPNSVPLLIVQNQNESPEFAITNPLKLYDHTGAASGDSIFINGSSGQGMLVDLGDVPHNSESADIEFAISDISHVALLGTGKDWINKLRAKADVMYWFGGSGSVVNPLDQMNSYYIREISPPLRFVWDLDAVVVQPSNMSIDYPDLIVDPHKSSLLVEGQNTLLANTTLRRMDSPGGGSWTEYPTPAAVKIRVPRFQPANWGQGAGDPGYQALVTVWVDADSDGRPDIPGEGDAHAMGRYEAYRQFIVGLNVPADRKLDFATGQLDIGSEPHGYQSRLGARYTDQLVYAKDYTLKNSGNVNLYDVRLLLRDPWSAGIWDWLADSLFCDGVDWRSFVPVVDAFDQTRRQILSTINGDDETQPPDPKLGSYSLHKPRVGDTDGAEMTVPDVRPGEGGGGFTQELRPQLTIKAPLGTPFGSYASRVYAVDYGGEWAGGSQYNANAAVSLSPMEVVLSVRETKLTGPPYGYTESGAADPTIWDNRYQVDQISLETGAVDATAAAYRDPLTEHMRLIFSSNRLDSGGSPTEDDLYLLYTAALPWIGGNVQNWEIPDPNQAWWKDATGFPDQQAGEIDLLFSEFNGAWDTVRFSAPAVASFGLQTYLAFKGDAYAGGGGGSSEVARSSKVFLARLQPNGLPNLGNPDFYYVAPDAELGKDTPRPLAYTDPRDNQSRFFLFWSQESAGKWEIYYTARQGFFSGLEADWQVPKKLELPRGMMSGRDPMPIFRPLLADGSTWDNPVWISHIDVFYSGTQRHKGDPDIYWSRYKVVEKMTPAWGLTLEPVAFPASVLEPMERVQKSGEAVFVSFGVDWDMDWWVSDACDDHTCVWFLERGTTRYDLVGGDSGNDPTNRLARDTATGAYVFKQRAYTVVLDPGAGLVRITTSDPTDSPLPMSNEPVYISYRPKGYRVTRDDAADAHPVAFIDQIVDDANPDSNFNHDFAPTRLWVLWRRSSVESPGGAMYYKTFRLGVDTGRDLYLDPQLVDDFTGIHLPYNLYNLADPMRMWSPLWFIDWARGRHWFPLFEEGNEGLRVRVYEKSPGGPVQFFDIDGAPRWIEERGDTLAQMEVATNQANLAAFLDPIRIRRAYDPNTGEGWHWLPSVTRVWAFWTGSVGYKTDLFYEALVPRFESGDAPELYVVPPDRYH